MASSPIQIPDQLKRRGRGANQQFAQDEKLYLRFQKLEAGRVPIQSIRCPDQSTNRSLYCTNCEWVLLPNFQSWGVGSLTVKDMPPSTTTSGNVKFEFGVIHEPEDDNFSHTELSVDKDKIRVRRESKINDQVKLEYRMKIADKVEVIKMPN